MADSDLDMQVSDNVPPSIRLEDLEDVAASNCMDADLERAAEQTFSESNDVQEAHPSCDMEYGVHGLSAGDDCDSDGHEWLDKGSEVADDDDVEMEREDETDDEVFMMMEEMYFPMDKSSFN
jgi:hypothetical protein